MHGRCGRSRRAGQHHAMKMRFAARGARRGSVLPECGAVEAVKAPSAHFLPSPLLEGQGIQNISRVPQSSPRPTPAMTADARHQVTVVGSRLDTRVIPAGSGRKSTLETGILTSLTLTDIIHHGPIEKVSQHNAHTCTQTRTQTRRHRLGVHRWSTEQRLRSARSPRLHLNPRHVRSRRTASMWR